MNPQLETTATLLMRATSDMIRTAVHRHHR
jgi:hypothetical protein